MLKNIYHYFDGLNPLQRESIRILMVIFSAVLLNIFMYLANDLDTEIREWAKPTITILASANLKEFVVYYFTPFFLYTLAKAWGLNELRHFKNVAHFMMYQVSGVLYCLALMACSIAFHLERLSLAGHQSFLSTAIFLFIIGIIYFYILQCVTQNTALPNLMSSKTSQKH